MAQFKICPVGKDISVEADCTIIEAESATFDETSGAVSFHDADSNLVGRFLNVSFFQLPPAA